MKLTNEGSEMGVVVEGLYGLYTLCCFLLACLVSPLLLATYLCTQICRRLYFSWLEAKYPQLEFVKQMTVRTVVDTHRNQGIITALLHVNSPCQINYVTNRIQSDIVEREEGGKRVFPHLRRSLTSRWGCYAWVKGSEKRFDLQHHVLLLPGLFKGRPVDDSNVQEYMTDVVSKLLPPELPPWQVCLMPSTGDTSYLLIRLHHLYLSEDNLSLGDLLLLKEEEGTDTWTGEAIPRPTALWSLVDGAGASMSNHWNEYVSKHDPVEEPSLLKAPRSITLLLHLVVATVGAAVRERIRSGTPLSSLLTREAARRGLDADIAASCTFSSLRPLNLVRSCVGLVWGSVSLTWRVPGALLRGAGRSPVLLYWLYLVNLAREEVWSGVRSLYSVPRVLLEQVVLPERPSNVHHLQTLSLCGRKVVGWSRPVPLELVCRVGAAAGASPGEVALSGAAASLREYFAGAGLSAPASVVTTARFASLEQLLARAVTPSCGQLCLPLPTDTDSQDPLSCLRSLRSSLRRARSDQSLLYLASLYRLDHSVFTAVFPSIFARACLYLLSRRYSVTLTQVESSSPDPKKRQLLWGPRVEKIMYWRPPQANICVSLTLLSYGGNVQLGVMADAQLAPHHSRIATSFSDHLVQLADALHVPHNLSDNQQVVQ